VVGDVLADRPKKLIEEFRQTRFLEDTPDEVSASSQTVTL
jgi:hypothetical protein